MEELFLDRNGQLEGPGANNDSERNSNRDKYIVLACDSKNSETESRILKKVIT